MADQPRASTPAQPAVAVAAALGATLLVVLLAAWAASIGPDDIFRGDGRPESGPSEVRTGPAEHASVEPPGDQPDRPEGEPPAWLTVLAVLIQVAAVVGAAYLVFRMARWGRRRQRHPRSRVEPARELDFEVIDAPQRVAEAIAADASGQREALLEGTPRNAIVACWHRFEQQARSIGLARKPWETSSEFTLRLLDLVAAEPDAVAELAALYREARFSDHELSEDARHRASAALDRIHGSLGARR
jgi:hypothetical protein